MDSSIPSSFLSTDGAADTSAEGALSTPNRPMRAAKTGAMHLINYDQQEQMQMQQGDPMEMMDESVGYEPLDITRTAPRKRKANDTTLLGASKRGRGGGGRGGRGRGRRVSVMNDDVEDDSSLFAILKAGKAPPMAIVDDWVSDYKNSPDAALLKLLQLFIDAAGCKSVLTQHMLMSGDYQMMVRKMTEEFDEDSGEYPIIINAAVCRRFRSSFADFIFDLVDKCKSEIIYDQKLMDSVIQLLVVLADNQVRAFRHTATLAAMKLETALVYLFVGLAEDENKNNMQLEIEKRKQRAAGGGNERLELLINKKQEYTERMEEIRQMMTYLFKSVFIHRYRDIVPEIRSICIQELSQWILTLPSVFLDDLYLKYIGWTLHDKVAEVRLKCLQALCPLYDNLESAQKLVLFSTRFKAKIVAMVLDRDFDVAVQAVKVVTALMKSYDAMLENEDCEKIYELVFCTHRGLATAAGDFVNCKLFAMDPNAAQGWVTRKGKDVSPNMPIIRDLVMFFIESDLHRHGAYLVDSLIDTNPMMKDWPAMTDLLLEQVQGPEFDGLDEHQERVLIEIMVCAVKQTAAGEIPVARASTRKHTHTRENRTQTEERIMMTEHFIMALPQLLQKYVSDAEELENLLQIATHFDLSVYVNGRHDKHLENLLRRLEELVEKHAEEELLKRVCKVLANLCDQPAPFFQRCHTAKERLLDSIVLNFKNNLQQFNNEDAADPEDIAALMHSVRKVVCFHCFHDLHQWKVFDSLSSLAMPLDDIISKIGPEQCGKIKEKALTGVFLSLVWNINSIRNGNPTQQSIDVVCSRRDMFVTASCAALDEGLGDDVFLNLCDLLTLCNEKQQHEKLRYKLEDLTSINFFVQDNVFDQENKDESVVADQEQAILRVHRKRKLLAAYCKMITFGVLPISEAAQVITHYLEIFEDFGDIMKYLMARCREIDKLSFSKAVSTALQEQFQKLHLDCSGQIDPNNTDFMKIRDLAKRLALTFGPDAKKIRDPIAMLHKEGIVFVFKQSKSRKDAPPPYVAYLEIVMEFTSRLIAQDKKAVLAYLDKQVGEGFGGGEEWHSLLLYRNSLIQAEADGLDANATKRGRKPRQQMEDTLEEQDTGVDE